jgi:hypothetical protein
MKLARGNQGNLGPTAMDYSIKAVRTDDSETGLTSERHSSFSIANASGRSPRLASALQATLDLESLVIFFAGELRGIVSCEGIEYVNDSQGIHIITGELRRHRCSYTLNSSDRSLGQMVFTRGKRFNKSELALLESLLSEIFWPLQRALQHQQDRTMSNKNPAEPHACAGSEGRRETNDPHCRRMRGPIHRDPAEAPTRQAIDTGRLSLAPLGPLSQPPIAESTSCIDTSDLGLVRDEGQP